MTTVAYSDAQLDAVLALQFTVAWAGEGLCEPARLAWWQTDLIDAAGGGDLLTRLLPKTHVWAGLEAVRAAAVAADRQARLAQAQPEGLRTLFFWGAALDEKLAERLADHKRSGKQPEATLPLPLAFDRPFAVDAFSQALTLPEGTPRITPMPGGRQLSGPMPGDLLKAAKQLAAALLPLSDRYPTPFYRIGE